LDPRASRVADAGDLLSGAQPQSLDDVTRHLGIVVRGEVAAAHLAEEAEVSPPVEVEHAFDRNVLRGRRGNGSVLADADPRRTVGSERLLSGTDRAIARRHSALARLLSVAASATTTTTAATAAMRAGHSRLGLAAALIRHRHPISRTAL
jgi:hypothetical protein